MTDATIVSSRKAFTGRVFDVRVDRVDAGGAQRDIDVVQHGASMAILATLPDGRLVLVRQYRHAAAASLWEIPAGTADAGEDPRDGAIRELREETGYRSGDVTHIGSFYTTPGFCDEILHLYRAQQLEAGPQALDDDERIDVGTFTLQEAWRLVDTGGVADCKTVLALLCLKAGAFGLGGHSGAT